ncbi:MAG: MFS transporter [Anaerolineales bacterium]
MSDTHSPPQKSSSTPFPHLPLNLSVIAFTRTVLYTGHRMVYPFLPAIARGLGVTLETAAIAVTIRSALGVFSPLLGSFGDTRGRKTAMSVGLMSFALGALLVALWPTFAGLSVGLILSGAGLLFFDPAIQAYVGDRVAYERRAMAMAAVEFGWSGAFLFGVPWVGYVIEKRSWNVPFFWLAGLGCLALALVVFVLPGDIGEEEGTISLRRGLKEVLTHRASLGALGVTLAMITGVRNIMIVYGAWFERMFALSAERLGAVSSVIGVAGVVGLILVGIISDRLGKRPSMILGLGMNLLSSLALPFLGDRMIFTLVTIFIFSVSFEFSIVTGFSLLSELRPKARATLMAFNAAAVSAGDAVGSFFGSRIFQGGIGNNVAVSVVMNILAISALWFLVRLEGE